jgi:hypothetical protein
LYLIGLCCALSACGRSKHAQHARTPSSHTGDGDAGGDTSTLGNSGQAGSSGGLATGGTSGDSGAGGTESTSAHSTLNLDGAPFYTRFQRLTNSQWEHAVTDLLRLDAPPNLAKDFEMFKECRKLCGDEIPLSFDANNGYSVSSAIQQGRKMEALGMYHFEEPIPQYDYMGLAQVADALDVPVSAGEH